MAAKIEFDKETYLSLCREYDRAVKEGREQFSLNGNLLLTSYAKYLIQHLSTMFEIPEKGKK